MTTSPDGKQQKPRKRTPRTRTWCAVVFLCVLAGVSLTYTRARANSQSAGSGRNPAPTAGPAPGSFVDNTATADGLDTLAVPITVTSNTVRARVDALESIAWDAPQGARFGRGLRGVFLHRLTNASNVPVDVRLDVANEPGDGFDLSGFALVRDDDTDGLPSPGDSTITPGGVVHLPLDGTVRVLIGFDVDLSAPAGSVARFRLSATTVGQAVPAMVVDTASTDPDGPAALRIELVPSRNTAEIGDALDFTARVTNTSSLLIGPTLASVSLPPGFAYLTGTTRGDSLVLPDPAGGAGPTLAFDIGALAPAQIVTLRYRVRVGPGAEPGEAISRASAVALIAQSNVATASVVILDRIFADEAGLLGTVFVDLDSDGRRGAGDAGLAGVRIVLDDGTFAITDGFGQYSLYGLTPRTHGLRVDPTSLPDGAKLISLDHRDAGTPGFRFVDLQRGDFQRADFAIAADSVTRVAPQERREMIARDGPLGAVVRRPLNAEETGTLPGDPRSRPTSAQWGEADAPSRPSSPGPSGPTLAAPGPGGYAGVIPPYVQPPPAGAEDGTAPPDTWQWFGFVGRKDGDTLTTDQATLRVAGNSACVLELRVNSELVSLSRVGMRRLNAAAGLQTWDYIGVRLRPGVNTLELVERTADGSEGTRGSITLIVPDRLARVEIDAPAVFAADGRSITTVRVRALDENGVPVAGRLPATLEAGAGELLVDDADPVTPGVQTVVEGGLAEFRLRAPAQPGTATITATVAGLRARTSVDFLPDLRPLFMVGSLEWKVGWNQRLTGVSTPYRARSGFEQPFQDLATESSDGRLAGGARGSLFARGRVAGDLLLTLGYDSDRPQDLRRFRDIQPDAFYPLYGDGSVRGYTAQSTGSLYARLDRPGASLLYGDFVTNPSGGGRSLGAYSRSLTGVQQHFENRRMRMDAFASRGRAQRTVDELRGLGVSGPYTVSRAPIIENSEQVEILVRDRNQPGIVRSATPQTRFVDYELDPYTGRLLFKQPVPGYDAELNPVSVRIGYETRDGGDPYWVGGVEGRAQVARRVELGGSVVADDDLTRPYRLGSVFAATRMGESTRLEAEFARTAAGGVPAGGWRFEAVHDRPDAQGRFWAANTDTGFSNPHSGYAPGRAEFGMRWTSRVDERLQLLSEGMFTSEAAGALRGGMLIALDRRLGGGSRGEFGVRASSTRTPGAVQDPPSLALRAKLTSQLPRFPELSGFAELEQDVVDTDRRLAAVGGEYRFSTRGRLYARHELASTLTGPYAFDAAQRRLATVLGVDADITRSSRVFSEYRLADAFAAREAEAVMGLRNAWRVGAYRINTSFERLTSFEADGNGPTTAVTGGLESLDDPNVKVSTRMELRTSRASDGYLMTMAGAFRANRAWSVIGRTLTDINRGHDRGNAVRMRTQLGFAYRNPDREAFDALGRYELRIDREPTDATHRTRHLAHMVALNSTGRLARSLQASLGWAGKLAGESSDGLDTRTGAQWLHGRLSRTFAKQWDAGVHASTLFGPGSHDNGLGCELGYQIQQGAWMSAGWNRFGYYDRDLPDEAYTRAGVYLRVRARFDESILGGFAGGGR